MKERVLNERFAWELSTRITSNKKTLGLSIFILVLKTLVDFGANFFKRSYIRVVEQHFAAKALETGGSQDWHLQLLCFARVAMPLWHHDLTGAETVDSTASSFKCRAVATPKQPNQKEIPSSEVYRIGSLKTGVFTYIWLTFTVNVGKHTIHGPFGYW